MIPPEPTSYVDIFHDDFAEKLRFLFQRFTYKVTQTATTQEWYKNDMPPTNMESWEQDGCIYLFTNGPPKSVCVRNDSDTPKNIKDAWILQPGESFTTQDQGWISMLVNKESVHPKTSVALTEAIAQAAEELKVADECPQCGKVLTLGDPMTCPHVEVSNYEFGTFVGATGFPDKPSKTVVYATKQISPVEKPKGRFIKLK